MNEQLPSDGLHSVERRSGQVMPYWVVVKTINRRPVYGEDRELRGYRSPVSAYRGMRRLTRIALQTDPTLARFVWDTALPAASAKSTTPETTVVIPKRGRPPGKTKPGPVPVQRDARIEFSSQRFILAADGTNSVAQVWRCVSNTATARGRAARLGNHQTGDLPHMVEDYAVTIRDDKGLAVALDEMGLPVVYSRWDAERDALYFYDEAPEPKLPLGRVHYRVGAIEVHFMSNSEDVAFPYKLFDDAVHEYIPETGTRDRTASYGRLDGAIEAAERIASKGPPSARLARLFHEAEEETDPVELQRKRHAEERAERQAEKNARWMEKDNARLQALPPLHERREFISEAEAERRYPDHPHFQKRRVLKDLPTLLRLSRPKYERGATDQRPEDDDDMENV